MNKIKSIIQGLYGISESENMIPKESARFTLHKTVECLELALKEHDKEIRAKAIDEFATYMSDYIYENQYGCVDDLLDRPYTTMLEIAEQMKAGGK